MTGPEHYRESERYAKDATDAYQKWWYDGRARDEYMAAGLSADLALVHATLAAAAAGAMNEAGVGLAAPEFKAWQQAAGTPVDAQP